MNSEDAKQSGLKALDTTQGTLEGIRKAMERGDWHTVGIKYTLLSKQATQISEACKRLIRKKSSGN